MRHQNNPQQPNSPGPSYPVLPTSSASPVAAKTHMTFSSLPPLPAYELLPEEA
jgi:hypothetical protein